MSTPQERIKESVARSRAVHIALRSEARRLAAERSTGSAVPGESSQTVDDNETRDDG